MSVQSNQYLMWGIKLPYKWHEEWEAAHNNVDFYETFENFMNDSAFDSKIVHHEGIFCLFDGMNGKYIIIGRVLEKTDEGESISGPLSFEPPTEIEQEFIREAVKRVFDVEGEFKFWLVTNYR